MRHVLAVNPVARAAGVRPGITVADAQAILPGLRLSPADPVADRALLERLAEWGQLYTPWVAPEVEGDGLWLDISGCAHLFNARSDRDGEAALLGDLVARMARFGLTARAALADTPGAAWAWAHFGAAATPCLPPGSHQTALAALPVTALRLPPPTALGLARLGLRRIGDLYPMPRAALATRFGPLVAQRLDQALGMVDEPISPRQSPLAYRLYLSFAEPIGRPDDIAAAVRHLLADMMTRLEAERLGVRRLEVTAFRLDATTQRLMIGTSRPSRDAAALFRLLAEPLSGLDAGLGIETLCLSVPRADPQDAEQAVFLAAGAVGAEMSEDFARLLDSLGNRLGFDHVMCFAPRQSHLPERAVRHLPAGTAMVPGADWPVGRRPLRLFLRPEPVDVVAPLPDSPPVLFRWRRRSHRLARAEGPERLAGEWWREPRPDRDYYCVEDETGRRFWLFREGLYGQDTAPRWFIHGVFP
jgi:protein ImuB